MIYLMNSAVMPAGCYGTYQYRPVVLAELNHLVHGDLGEWESCIGYAQNADLIEGWTGVKPEISRREVTFKDGDSALVMRLRKRVVNPATKGAPVSDDPADWEFAWVDYTG